MKPLVVFDTIATENVVPHNIIVTSDFCNTYIGSFSSAGSRTPMTVCQELCRTLSANRRREFFSRCQLINMSEFSGTPGLVNVNVYVYVCVHCACVYMCAPVRSCPCVCVHKCVCERLSIQIVVFKCTGVYVLVW